MKNKNQIVNCCIRTNNTREKNICHTLSITCMHACLLVSLIYRWGKKKRETNPNESLIFITDFWVHAIRAKQFYIFFFLFKIRHVFYVRIRVCISTVITSIRYAIISRLLHILCIRAQNERQNGTQKTYYCLICVFISRARTNIHIYTSWQTTRARFTYFNVQKKLHK